MKIEIILLAIFLPPLVTSVISIIRKPTGKINGRFSDTYFIVMLPNAVLWIGILDVVTSMLLLFGFTLFSTEKPHLIFYLACGAFLWLGMYLALKTLCFRVIVDGEKITVFSVFKKSYTFTFNDITSAVRQIKNNRVRSERIVLKTTTGKRMIVENSEISYMRFMKRIIAEVKSEYLFGFE